MPWVLLDVVLAVLALALLSLAAVLLYKRVRALLRVTGTAAEQVGTASAGLDAASAAGSRRTLSATSTEEKP